MRYETARNEVQLLIWGALLASLLSCAPALDKRAAVFEGAGDYEAAANVYMEGLRKKPARAEWQVGLKRFAQIALVQKADAAAAAFGSEDYSEASELYSQAFAYKEAVEAFGVPLDLNRVHQRNFEVAANEEAQRLYDEALTLLSSGEPARAEAVLDDLIELKSDEYRDVGELWLTSVYEQAMLLFDREE